MAITFDVLEGEILEFKSVLLNTFDISNKQKLHG